MARLLSDEELQLKKRARRRLVGAIVLVTAVAVVLPMVLDSEPRPVNQNVDIQIPPPDSSEFKPKGVAPATGAGSSAGKAAQEAAKAEPPAVSPAIPIADPAATPPTPTRGNAMLEPGEPKSASAGRTRDTSTATGGVYAVQIEALADAAKARQLEKKVAAAGLKTYTEVVASKTGELTRVRAGPYPTREAAEQARALLKKVGLDGKVVRE